MIEGQRRYRLAVLCPKCKRQPAVGFYPSAIEWSKSLQPGEPIMTVVCSRVACRTVYRIAAVALQYAVLVGKEGDEEGIRWAA